MLERQAAIFFSILLLSVGALSCRAQESTDPLNVTLVDLLENPQEFVGQRVSIVGYLADHANLELFLTREHADARDYISSIVVGDYDDWGIHRSDCIDNMVEVTGVIAPDGANNYILGGVSKIAYLTTNKTCWETQD